jgi:hypothetical protein
MSHDKTNIVRFAKEPSMSSLAYLASAKSVDAEGKFGPILVIDGIGDFAAKQLNDVVSALTVQGKIRNGISG